MVASKRPSALVHALIGSDRLLRQEALSALLAAAKETCDSLDVTRVDGADAELADVLDEVRTVSLFGGGRAVIVEDADAFVSDHRRALERYCEDPSNTGRLILLCNTMPKNTRLYRHINQLGGIVACAPPRPQEVTAWIGRRAKEIYDKNLTPRAATMLRDFVGDAPSMLDAEINKLADYVGGRVTITEEDIEAITGRHREEKVFVVTDAMAAGHADEALSHWEQVWATDRAAPGRAIPGLAWGVRRLLDARRAWAKGANLHALSRSMFTDPTTLRRRLESVTDEQLEAQQRDLLAADVAVKTGGSTVDVAVEKFIVKHSAAR